MACSAAASRTCRFIPAIRLTPGVGATKDAKRLKIEDAPTITKIPVLPISYADAQPLLEALTGRVAPPTVARRLGHHLSRGARRRKSASEGEIQLGHQTRLRRDRENSRRDVPDEWVLRGNHHDAWVNGAEDPTSGMVAVLEEARALGELLKAGWKPKRTIIYCAWDGEEPGLLGSTEWAETHYDELRAHAVAYINSDSNGTRLSGHRRFAHAGKIRQRCRARDQRSGNQAFRLEAQSPARNCRSQIAGGAREAAPAR